ncbi:MAG: PAS domain S-box protein, partial [Candidatus Cloacimonetes bacterium]|nr:PAS domain S-box protein [Candidatus Cloacimonadota bacterium]
MKQIKELLAKLNEVDEKEQIKLLLEFSDKQKQKFESMILNSPDMIMNQNPDGKIEYISPQCERILGYTADELKHMDIQTLIYPDDFEETIETTLKTLQGNELTNFEYRFIHKNGDIVWLNHTARPIICDGELTEILSTVRDITKSKKAKEILQNNEARLHSVFSNTSNIAVQSYDKNRKVTYWNKASEALYGYSQEEVINKKLEDLIIPNEMRETVISLIKNWHENNIKIPNSELVLLRKDGSPVHVYSSHVMIDKPDGEKEMFCIDVDISERKHVEKEYHRSMSLLKSAEHLSKTGGWRFTVKDQFMYWTDEAFSIHEIDIKPQTIDTDKQIEDSLLCYDEKDRPIVMKAFQDCRDKGTPYDLEFPFTTKKGNRIWIRTTAKAEYKNNKIVSVMGNIFDITERKQAESEIAQQKANLNSLIENTSDFIWSIDKDYRLLTANTAFLKFIEPIYNEILPLGSLLMDKDRIPKDIFDDWKQKYDTAFAGKNMRMELNASYTNVKKILDLSLNPIVNSRKEVVGVSVFGRDVTENKQA